MEAARMFKANLKLEGKPCGWCKQAFQLGEDAAVCAACSTPHHRRCWDGNAGCATASCMHAPLPRLDAPPPGAPPPGPVTTAPPGMVYCAHCGRLVSAARSVCSYCRAVTNPHVRDRASGASAPGAVAALVYGLIGLFICGVIFGPIALIKSAEARQAIAQDPTLDGGGLATAGLVLGIIDIVAWAMIMLAR